MENLFDLAQRYLNQGVPSISPIFSDAGITSIPVSNPVEESTEVGLTPEQLRLLYLQQQGGDGDGGGPITPPPEIDDPYADSPYDQYGNLKGTTSPLEALKTAALFFSNPLAFTTYNVGKSFMRARQQRQFEKELQNQDFRDMVAENRAARTGGYQAGYDRDFMEGPKDGGRGNNPGDKGGSDTMGSS